MKAWMAHARAILVARPLNRGDERLFVAGLVRAEGADRRHRRGDDHLEAVRVRARLLGRVRFARGSGDREEQHDETSGEVHSGSLHDSVWLEFPRLACEPHGIHEQAPGKTPKWRG